MPTRVNGQEKPLRHEQKLGLGPLEIAVSLDLKQSRALRSSAPFRYVVRPTLRHLRSAARGVKGAMNGHAPAVAESKPLVNREAPASPEARAIIERIAGYEWYHTIDLPHGVSTPGHVDHRNQLHHYGLPEDMTGLRVLDVATFDGFFAFEFARRGAEVIGIDLASPWDVDVPRFWRARYEAGVANTPKGHGFALAKELLGSTARREVCSVYDLTPERFGMFDIVFCSDMLIHVRDPLAALEAMRGMTRGKAVFGDVYQPELDIYKDHALAEFCQAGQTDMWWNPNVACYNLWLRLAGYSRVEEVSRFVLEADFYNSVPKVVLHASP